MTIDPEWLAQVIELTTGRTLDAPGAQSLAAALSDPAEVLPWLVLRQNAPGMIGLADDPAIMAALTVQADRIARPHTRAQNRGEAGFAVSAPLVAIDRAVCDGLHLIVAEEVARAELAEEVHGLFVHRHAVAPAGLDHAFRYRIGHPVER